MGDSDFKHARPLSVGFSDPTVGPIKEIHLAAYSAHALTTSGELWGWGYNGHGQVGDGTTTLRKWPRKVIWPAGTPPVITSVTSTMSGALDIYAAWYALDSQGNVWSWGYNGYGQLALGDTSSTYYEPQKTSLTGVARIVGGGGQHGVAHAITNNGDAFAAGYSNTGQTGLGNSNQLSWAQVNLPAPCIDIATTGRGSYGHTLWLLDDGRVFAAGYSAYGQSGTGASGNVTSDPVHVSTIANVVKIWAGGGRMSSSYAACANGDFYCWGYNGHGQLGLGNTTNRNTPALHPRKNIVAVARGTAMHNYAYGHTVLLDNQGYAYAAGYNAAGQCGLGHRTANQTDHDLMVLPYGIQGTITQIQTMGYYNQGGTALLDSSGRVWACGYGGGHMLCTTPSTESSLAVPAQVML